MRKHIKSSWNSDRVAGSMLNKEHKARAVKPAPVVKIYKTSELFTRLYGREAYEAWVAREAEINELMHDRSRHSFGDIIAMREANYRQMKVAGKHRTKRTAKAPVMMQGLAKAA